MVQASSSKPKRLKEDMDTDENFNPDGKQDLRRKEAAEAESCKDDVEINLGHVAPRSTEDKSLIGVMPVTHWCALWRVSSTAALSDEGMMTRSL